MRVHPVACTQSILSNAGPADSVSGLPLWFLILIFTICNLKQGGTLVNPVKVYFADATEQEAQLPSRFEGGPFEVSGSLFSTVLLAMSYGGWDERGPAIMAAMRSQDPGRRKLSLPDYLAALRVGLWLLR